MSSSSTPLTAVWPVEAYVASTIAASLTVPLPLEDVASLGSLSAVPDSPQLQLSRLRLGGRSAEISWSQMGHVKGSGSSAVGVDSGKVYTAMFVKVLRLRFGQKELKGE